MAVAVGVGVRVAVAIAVGVGVRVGLQRKELGFFSQYVGVGVGVGVGVLVGNLTQYQYGSCASMQSSKVVQGLRGSSHCPLTPPSSSSAAPDGPPPSGGACAITALTAMATPAIAAPHTSTMRCMSFLRNEISLLENEKRSHVHDVVVVSRPRAEVKVDISRCFVGVMLGDRNSAGAAVRRHGRQWGSRGGWLYGKRGGAWAKPLHSTGCVFVCGAVGLYGVAAARRGYAPVGAAFAVGRPAFGQQEWSI